MPSGSYGLVGLFRPFTVYPSEMVYWHVGLRLVNPDPQSNIP